MKTKEELTMQDLEAHNRFIENLHMKDFIDWCESEEIIWRLVKDQLFQMKKRISDGKKEYLIFLGKPNNIQE